MKMESITPTGVEEALRRKVEEIRVKPEYQWADDRRNYAVDPDGRAAVRAGVANCDLDFDIWEGLRNPAVVGRHPIGLHQIWEFYATNDIKNIRPDGTPNYLSMPTPFAEAKRRFTRAVIISVMLPLSTEVFWQYGEAIVRRESAPVDAYRKAWTETNQLLDEATAKLAMDLHGPHRAVIPMTAKMVAKISEQAVPPIHRGNYHGPCKGGNYSQKSVAVLAGLAQFGVSRTVFRDEMNDDQVRRLLGPVRSIVLFDDESLILDETDGVVHLTETRWAALKRLADFTDTDQDVNNQRYCTHIPLLESGQGGCGLCIEYCPTGALPNSTPQPNGEYADNVQTQRSRFSEGSLQFDFATCLEERSQKGELYADYMCGRCVAICASRGKRRPIHDSG